MAITVAITIKLDDTYTLRETDRRLENLLPGLRKHFGSFPNIYSKYNTSNPEKWTHNSNENYIVIPYKGRPVYLDIGPTFSVSKYCGKGTSGPVQIAGTIQNVGYSVGPYNVVLNGNEKPQLTRRGVIDESVPGDADDPYVFTLNSQIKLPRNASREEVMSAFMTYLYTAKTHGADSEITESKMLFVVNKEDGRQEPIKDFKTLAAAFPRYFQFQSQFEAEAISSLESGWTPAGWKVYVDGNWWTVESRYVGLWEKIAKANFSESAINQELLGMGYTQSQINAIRAIKGLNFAQLKELSSGNADTGSGSGSGSGSGGKSGSKSGGGGKNPDGTVWTGPEGYRTGRIQDITIQRSRNIFFSADETRSLLGSSGISVDNSKPIMYQIYRGSLPEAKLADFTISGTSLVNQYVFDIIPNEISYSGFGGDWVSIDRVGAFPFIDWKSFKLLQISFQFTIASKNGPVTADGLDVPITDQIEKLQRMAQTPYPVMFYGFDTLLTNQFRYDNTGTPRGIQFIIQDLSITASRRNSKMEITRANANITLQEIPIERTTLIGMPRLRHTNKPPDEPVPFTDPEYGLQSSTLSSLPDQTIEYNRTPGE
jgi:hypothetical protein